MSAPRLLLCPVCWRDLRPTINAKIPQHFDSVRANICPASGEPYRITIERRPEFEGVDRYRNARARKAKGSAA